MFRFECLIADHRAIHTNCELIQIPKNVAGEFFDGVMTKSHKTTIPASNPKCRMVSLRWHCTIASFHTAAGCENHLVDSY